MWRQGDIFIRAIPAVPPEAADRPLPHTVLAHGELTGHSHRVVDPAALFAGDGCFYLDVHADGARVVHDEHGTITLDRGVYRVWRQREYTPQRIVTVQD
ncbi:hypothetical protein [Methylorubrum podarium]|jgi:hypothetical protein|uniref:Uncharacterized protein n=1 Tax=Methylorubrum podarium TaxID=200476 RepID=A0ABV1QR27_9HYPH|nr:hypothetical protein [Methylorubrum podarium]MDV2983807.1 hypothetical protein [Methylobacteriaceae bacterium AG10]GJE68750.1 hypothetical protein CHKEEEPN_0269 [Methylorubrum podarium]